MSILKGISAAPFAVACLLVVVSIPLAGSSNNNNKKHDKAKDTVDRVREPDPPKADPPTDTAKERAERENRKEKEREKERAREYNKKRVVPPSPKP